MAGRPNLIPQHVSRLRAERAEARGRRAGARRLRRLLASSDPPYRVELGAGDVCRDGWIATDVWSGAPYTLDATGPWPFPPGSISHVFGDNMIEHVPLDGARALFRHAMKAMRSGGRIRLVTPDAERCAAAYLEGGDLLRAHIEAHRGAGMRVEHDVDALRAVFIEYGHAGGYAWDYDALSAELAAAGFVSIERYELEHSPDPVLRGLEWRTLPVDRALMLAVEALRP